MEYIDELKQESAEFIGKIDRAAANPDWTTKQVDKWKKLKDKSKKDIEKGTKLAVQMASL